MPAKTEAQRKAAGMALAAKRGEIPQSKLRGPSLRMFQGMKVAQLRDFATKPLAKGDKKGKK